MAAAGAYRVEPKTLGHITIKVKFPHGFHLRMRAATLLLKFAGWVIPLEAEVITEIKSA